MVDRGTKVGFSHQGSALRYWGLRVRVGYQPIRHNLREHLPNWNLSVPQASGSMCQERIPAMVRIYKSGNRMAPWRRLGG